MRPAERETGMALLTVLLLVAVMGTLTAAALETINRSVRMAGNGRTAMQARYHALGAEALALLRVEALLAAAGNTLTLAGGWHGRTFTLNTGDGGSVRARITDGGNCFNLNSVGDGGNATSLKMRPHGVRQFTTLMLTLGIDDGHARRAAHALADWVDADGTPLPLGGEDAVYARAPTAYRPSNTLLAETSELRAVAGITREIYDVIRPWVCALPTTDMSPININTLVPSQAPLLAMVLPGRLTIDAARGILAARPAAGWNSLGDFWSQPALAQLKPTTEELEQPRLTTRYFNLEIEVEPAGYAVTETGLLDVTSGRSSVVQRRWTVDE